MKTQANYLASSLFAFSTLLSGCGQEGSSITHGNLEITVSEQLYTSVNRLGSARLTKMQPSEYLLSDEGMVANFAVYASSSSPFQDEAGAGTQYDYSAVDATNGIDKRLQVRAYDDFPDLVSMKVTYINKSEKDLPIKGWVNHGYAVENAGDEPPFWAFQGSSSGERADWITPIKAGYFKKNYLGMNNSDYGGGIPVTDLWRKDAGIAIGHLELTPKLVSLPTEMKKNVATTSIGVMEEFDYPSYLYAGDTLKTLETFVMVHEGDYYNALQKYSRIMQKKGIQIPEPEPDAFESIWCAWGYERDFTLDEVIGTLPKVKELGIKWAVLDDGFQQAEGDWHTNTNKFPKGDAQMKEFVKSIHDMGLKAKLWWAPLAADPTSKLLAENPKMRFYTEDWSPQFITWWDAYYLSPTHPKTINHTKEVVNLFLKEWDFDGLKLDGQHMNAVPPDHNPENQLDDPVQAVERLPEFFQLIYDEARDIKPSAVVENCPCGTCMSFFNMPYMNQAVSSDPMSSWQIRHKGKTYKALIPNTAYYGDHVELSDNGDDFASSFGIGAVLGTKFTWPKDNPSASDSYVLTPEKEEKWRKWFGLYNEKMLSKEKYLGDLYDIGYDLPETHVILKGDTLHYAFYAEDWDGPITFRGLESGTIEVRNYLNDQVVANLDAQNPVVDVQFKDFLLVEVYPK